MAEKIKKGFFKVLPWSMAVLMILAVSAGIWQNFPTQIAEAAAINVATNTELTPGSQFTTFVGVPVYSLQVANSGDASDAITSLSPTPSGSVVDTTVTLHFFHDVNNNRIVDQGDVDIGADAAFDADNTFKIFDITDVEVPAAGSASILITADIGAGVNAQTFNLSFAAGADILMTVEPTGVFPLLNDGSLTVSNSPPAVTVANGANDPAAKTAKASATDVAVKQLAISAAAGTPDSIVSLAPTPAGTEDDNVNITSVIFYIDSGLVPGQVDGTDVQLVTTPATYTADNTKTTFTFSSPVQIAAATTVNILVVYNFGAGVTNGNTLTTIIAAAGDVVAGSGTAVTQNSTISATITIDTVAPAVTSATTGDADNDGKIDKLTVVYDSVVNDANYDAVAVGAYVMLGTGSGTGGATLVYNFTEAGAVDSGATPALVWTAANAQDLAGNNLNTAGAPANADDGAAPVVITVVRAVAGGLSNRITITYSEIMTITTGDGASTATKGDVTLAGTVAGFGVFAVPGDVTVPTAKNTVGGTGTTILTISLANEAGGYLDSTSTTEPSGAFAPGVSGEVVDGAGLSVNTATAPVSTSTGWDLIPPTIDSVTVSDTDGNGKIDQAVLVLDTPMRDNNVVSADGTLGGLTGTFISGFLNDATTNFNLTDDTAQPMNTALGAHSQFNYSGVTRKITDKVGNLLSGTAVPGEIADGDIGETDGAIPTIGTVTYKDEDGDGKIDRIMLTYTETVTGASVVSANDLVFDNVGSFTSAAFGGDASDLVTGAVSFTNINLGTEASVIATYDATSLLAISTQNAFSLTDGVNATSLQGSQTQVTIADGAAPVLGGDGGVQMYLDGNTNGSVDTFQTWWSENVTMTGSTVDDWTISGGDFNAAFSAAADDAGGNQSINVTVTADANKTGSTTAVTIAYDNGDANGSVKDVALNPAGTSGPQTLVDGAVPLPVSAVYKDADGNGTVDRIDVTMTAEASISCTFQLADWSIPTAGTVIGANTPSACAVSGNDIQVTVAATADKTGGGTNPTIRYSNVAPKGSVSDAGNLNQAPSFSAPVTATDAAVPIVTSRVTYDANGDGGLDRIVFTASESLDDDFSGLTVDVIGSAGEAYSTGDVATDNIFWVNYTWADSYNTGALPTTQITANTTLSDTLSNNIATDGVVVASTDGAAPVMTGSFFFDLGGDGTIDTLRTSWSESVTMNGSTAPDWTIVGGSMTAAFSVATNDAVAGSFLDVTVTADTDETGGTSAPTIAYDNDDANGSVVDASPALNPAGTTGPKTAEDAAAPVLLSAVYLDQSGAVGTVDTIRTTWSEDVTNLGALAADWTITGGDIHATFSAMALDFITDPYISITVTADADETGGAVNPTVTYNNFTGSIVDASPISVGLPAGITGPVDATDGAAPIVLTKVYQDTGANGSVETAVLTLSENVTFTQAQLLSDFTIANEDLTGFAGSPTTITGTGTSTMTFTSGSASTNLTGVSGGTEPTIAFLDDGINHITDGTNNLATFGVTSLTDDAIPVRYGAITYSDNGNDGTTDRVTMTYTEKVTYTYSDAEWVATANGLTGFDVTACTSCTNVTSLVLTASTTGTITGVGAGVQPQLAYTFATQNISDAAGKDAANIVATTLADGAAPVFSSALTSDNNSDGTVDRLVMTFSEPVTVTDGGTDNDITLVASSGTATVTAGAYGAVGTSTLTYVISVSATGNTAITIDPTYATAGAGSISDTVNEMADSETVVGTDGAKPAILSALTGDADADGTVDRLVLTFSENSDVTDGNAGDGLPAIALVASSGTATIDDGNYGGTGSTTLNLIITVSATGNTAITVTPTYTVAAAGQIDETSLTNNEMADGETIATGTDGAAPAILSATFYDADVAPNDGKLDLITVVWSENINNVADGSGDWALTGTNFGTITEGAVVCSTGTAGENECDYNFTATTVKTDVGNLSLAYSATGSSVTDGITPAAAKTITSASSPAFTDAADPVVASASPADGASGVALDASFAITFSEAMTTTDITTTTLGRSPTFTLGSVNGTWSVGNTVVTFAAHDAWAGLQIYTINLVQGSINSAAAGDSTLDNTAIVADPYTFTTVGGGGGGGGGGAGLPASVSVYSPNGGESWVGLSSHNITWSSTSTTISKVKLYYSLDRGVNFPYTIATDENNDGTYSWTVPNVPSRTVKIKVEGYDLNSVFVASDISDADFTITYTTPPPVTPETPGVPVAENPAGLVAGDLFKSPLSTTVYYFGSDNKRHIFPNEKTYKSWYPDWSGIKTITASELQQMTLGKNITVRPGTVLVKIDTNPKVYAVEPGGLLRWIPTEARIKILYGDDWAKKIIDVPLAFWGDYSFGADISADTHPTGALVQYSGTTDVYYIQGAEKRKITTTGFSTNNFRSEYVLAISTTISYSNGADISGAESSLTSIY